MTSNVQEFVGKMWDARYERRLPRDAAEMARGLARAVARDVEDCADYDPEMDLRVRWAREMISQRRRLPAWRVPKAEPGLELGVLMLLGRLEYESANCGAALAAGDGTNRGGSGL